MFDWILQYRLDLVAFYVLLWLGALGVHVRLRRRYGDRGVSPIAWLLLAMTAVVGTTAAEWAGRHEGQRLRHMLDGIAPTYAQEMQLLGHARLPLDASENDPLYLSLIEAQKRWQRVNHNVNDVYTFRKRSDGQIVLVVDSETDYDHNGAFEGEREQRTSIGEVYEGESDSLAMAFDGVANFDGVPYTDRWGTWVSANVPMFDEAGNVEAVLGVDYDARQWSSAIAWSRLATLGFASIVTMAVLSATAVVGITRAELAKRAAAERAVRESEGRLRAILDAEPEWVQVADLDGRITQINPAGVATMGAANAAEALGRSLVELVAPEHRKGYQKLQADCLSSGGGTLRFAIDVGDARRWVDAHAVPLRDAAGQPSSILTVLRDITAQKHAEEEKDRLQRALVDASRQAGMAEVATGVLHNVGNVLNSVNVSAGVLTANVQRSKVPAFQRAAGMIRDHRADLADFLTTDAKGRALPEYIVQLAALMSADQTEMARELSHLSDSIEHIKQIVSAQQAHAKTCDTNETLDVATLLEDAVRMNALSLDRHGIELVRAYAAGLQVTTDRHKVIQILVNLISNAKKAVETPGAAAEKRIVVSLQEVTSAAGEPIARIQVTDSGVGIPAENLAKLFTHGFTTRADGHGFGLHSAAIAAHQLKGSLTAHSEGPGRGATFTLEIPARPAAALATAH
jgi:PAS domain S-box-containing protein